MSQVSASKANLFSRVGNVPTLGSKISRALLLMALGSGLCLVPTPFMPPLLDPAIAAPENSLKGWFDEGVSRSQKGDQKGAIAAYSEALKFSSQQPVVYVNRAIAKWSLQDYTGALQDYNAALKLDDKRESA